MILFCEYACQHMLLFALDDHSRVTLLSNNDYINANFIKVRQFFKLIVIYKTMYRMNKFSIYLISTSIKFSKLNLENVTSGCM